MSPPPAAAIDTSRSAVEPLGSRVQTLDEMLAVRAAATPDAIAFAAAADADADAGDASGLLTYGELRAQSNALAAELARQGVGPGDRVALILPAGFGFLRAFFAALRLGAAPCAFDPMVPAATAARRAARVQPRLVLVGGRGAGAPNEAAGDLPRALAAAALRALPIDGLEAGGGAPRPLATDPDAIAYLQPTSGTSGEPRAAVIRHRAAIASLSSSRDFMACTPRDVLVGWVPPWHDLGLVRFVLSPVYLGAVCHLVQPAISTIAAWLETVSRVRATITGAPDFAYRIAARLVDPARVDLGSLRFATNGGEPVRESTITAFEQRFGIPGVVRPGYGLAEATLGVTFAVPGEPLRADAHGSVSCGRPFPGLEVRIAAGSDADADADGGEILVRGPSLFSGYFDDEAASRESLRDGWLHTGDAGRLDADGNLYVFGRQRAMLKRGGATLPPRELEEAATRLPGVRIAAAVGLPPAPGGFSEEITVAIEIAPDAAADAPRIAAEVAAAVRAEVGFAPERVVVLAPRTIPRTHNGKVRHRELAAALADGSLERAAAIVVSFSAGG